MKKYFCIAIYDIITLTLLFILLLSCSEPASDTARQEISLNSGWKTIASDTNQHAFDGFEAITFNDVQWKTAEVPHNWDSYYGYLRKLHGNRHGYAWYRKIFVVDKADMNKRYFLFFEGVGSYATVWINGNKVGYHAGGRTTFTVDITEAIVHERSNIIAVRADHPANIRDLPWVCGGCSDEWGFSEGSQPMGIFRPVTLIITGDIRIEPFGVHIWNDTTVSEKQAHLNIRTAIKNYSNKTRSITLVSSLLNRSGKKVAETETSVEIGPGITKVIKERPAVVKKPVLWSAENPYLYMLQTRILENNRLIDEIKTPCGIRRISWPVSRNDSTKQFLLNGKPVFINGIGEYEHMFGNSHAFTDEQIKTRTAQIKAAGFNAFRDAHQPHNLRYQEHWDREGILWWPQMSAHIWYDTPAFRENFKILLREWIMERRNCPSNIMWGLQNESTLPDEFVAECVKIIHELDPTSSSQRLITTCNGGTGTDWNVVQNWSGTYGGDPMKYDQELKHQLLNGEYGAWRSIDLHSEGPFDQHGIYSEDRMTQLLLMKVRQAESVREQCCGQFLWLLSSHDNPGRIQNGEGLRDMDRIGPVNYKGLFTPWGEPLDAFYMYRASYVSKEKEPMVYIVSHTWPNRWINPGIKDSLVVYSNCDAVELFNDIGALSFGKKKNQGIGHPFVWEKVEIRYNVLYALGYIDDKVVARDIIVLNHLPEAPGLVKQAAGKGSVTEAKSGYHYLYRVNCGGPDYTDQHGNCWMADRHLESDSTWGSRSWTDSFDGLPPFYGSQRRTFDPIEGTYDQKLFQTFRYGLEQLSFNFPVPGGEYLVELYFVEPWYGTGGNMDCKYWRLFDAAVNNEVVLKDFDIWSESGHDKAVKKEFTVNAKGGMLSVHFPQASSGQAIISAIAIACKNRSIQSAAPSPGNINEFRVMNQDRSGQWSVETWLDVGDKQFTGSQVCFAELPSLLYGADWIKTPAALKGYGGPIASFIVPKHSDVFVALPSPIRLVPGWMKSYNTTPLTLKSDDGRYYTLYSKRVDKDVTIRLGNISTPENEELSYTVMVVPVSALAAPADQRPVKVYASELSVVKGIAGRKRMQNGRHFIELMADTPAEIEWQISVGLASTYDINLRFQNSTGKPLKAELVMETSGGIEMHREVIMLENQDEIWQSFRTRTGTSINAGQYRVRLRMSNAKGLSVERIEVR